MNVAQQSTGAIIDTRWQESFYAHVDTFLTKARSVPEIIESCFGADRVLMQTEWFRKRPVDEQTRRKKFSKRFRKARGKFSKHHLTNERNISEHRLGYPGVEGKVIGPFGEVHTASPVKSVPTAESRRFDNPADEPDLPMAWLHTPQPVQQTGSIHHWREASLRRMSRLPSTGVRSPRPSSQPLPAGAPQRKSLPHDALEVIGMNQLVAFTDRAPAFVAAAGARASYRFFESDLGINLHFCRFECSVSFPPVRLQPASLLGC
jgi:hypothetical protein